MLLDKMIKRFFEVALVAFTCVAIFSTMSMVSADNVSLAEAKIIDDSGDITSAVSDVVWYQIDDAMVPVEFVEFPPMHISVSTNTLYNE